MDIIPIIISIITSVTSAMLIFVLQAKVRENTELKKKNEEAEKNRETALETGVRQLLSVRLEEIYDQYAESDTIPKRAYTRWMKLHDAYKGLHGNGTFDHMKLEIEEKHIVK